MGNAYETMMRNCEGPAVSVPTVEAGHRSEPTAERVDQARPAISISPRMVARLPHSSRTDHYTPDSAGVNAIPAAMTVHDVAAFLGVSVHAARRRLQAMMRDGLRRKFRGRATAYDRSEFLRIWQQEDSRP